MKNVYRKIRQIREEKGYTQRDVADVLGLVPASYNKIENGKTALTVENLQKIADFLGVSVKEILFDEQSSSSELDKRILEKEKRQLVKNLARQRNEFIAIINSILENYLKMAVSGFVSIQEGLFMQTLDKTFSELLQADLPNSDKIFLIVQKILKDFEANQIKPEYEVIIASLFFPFSSIDFDYYIKSGYIKSPAVINAYRYFKEKILSNE